MDKYQLAFKAGLNHGYEIMRRTIILDKVRQRLFNLPPVSQELMYEMSLNNQEAINRKYKDLVSSSFTQFLNYSPEELLSNKEEYYQSYDSFFLGVEFGEAIAYRMHKKKVKLRRRKLWYKHKDDRLERKKEEGSSIQ